MFYAPSIPLGAIHGSLLFFEQITFIRKSVYACNIPHEEYVNIITHGFLSLYLSHVRWLLGKVHNATIHVGRHTRTCRVTCTLCEQISNYLRRVTLLRQRISDVSSGKLPTTYN